MALNAGGTSKINGRSHGDTYIGQWKNMQRHGKAVITYSNKDAFEGEFDPASRWARPEEAIAASVAKGRARWDAEAFARENASTLKPVAATFFRCAALD